MLPGNAADVWKMSLGSNSTLEKSGYSGISITAVGGKVVAVGTGTVCAIIEVSFGDSVSAGGLPGVKVWQARLIIIINKKDKNIGFFLIMLITWYLFMLASLSIFGYLLE
jgi:hypothetical protein